MLEVEHLSCGYGDLPVLKDVSFSVGPGQRLGVIQGLHTFAGILFSVHRGSFPGRKRPSLRFDPIITPKLALSRREC